MINIVVLIAVAAAAVFAIIAGIRGKGGCGCGCSSCSGGCASAQTGNSDTTEYQPGTSLILEIGGMHCEKCSAGVAESLNALNGVSAEVDLTANRASVKLSKAVSEAALRTAVEDKGFELVRIQTV